MLKNIIITVWILIIATLLNSQRINYLNETENLIELEIILDNILLSENENFTIIESTNSLRSDDSGSPDLPYIKLNFAVPENGSIIVRANESNIKTRYLNKPIIPVGNSTEENKYDINYTINPSKYSLQKNLFTIMPKQSLNYYDIIPVIINPFNYNNDTKQLRYSETIKLTISINGNFPKFIPEYSDHSKNIYASLITNRKYGLNYYHTRSKNFNTSRFYRSHSWYKLEVVNDGIYELDYQFLSQLPLSDIDPRTIRIFTTGGAMTDPEYQNPGHEFREIPLLITGEEDGVFNQNDKIYFYAESRDGFGKNLPIARYNTHKNQLEEVGDYHFFNPFSKAGIYWITWGGNFDSNPTRMQKENNQNYQVIRNTGLIKTHYEEAKARKFIDGFNWYTQVFQSTSSAPSSYLFNINLEDFNNSINQKFSIIIEAELYASSNNDVTINPHNIDVKVNNQTVITHSWRESQMLRMAYSGNVFNNGDNNLTFTVSGNNINKYLKFFNIEWHKNLIKRNNGLNFFTNHDDIGKSVKYEITNPQNQSLTVFQVNSLFEIRSLTINNNTFIASNTNNSRFFIYNNNDYLKPSSISVINTISLDNHAPAHDVLIIYPQEFASGAERLKQIYQNEYQYNVFMASQESIFNNFSGGHPDPVAIRNFLQYLNFNAPHPKPLGVTLLGSGSNDMRNFSGIAGNKNKIIINQIQYNSSTRKNRTDATSDDFYANLTVFEYPEIIIGRIPAKSNQELNNYLDKLQSYLNNNQPGWWQFKFQMIADDNHYRTSETDTAHTTQTENASKIIEDNILVDKLFAIEYELDSFKKKPHVKNILVDKINEGRLYWLYIGHGSVRNTGDEQYFSADFDLPLLKNYEKYPIFYAASCNVGQFDLPGITSLAEELLLLRNAGSIISIAAARAVPSSSNASLLNKYIERAINFQEGPGLAMLNAKFQYRNSNNYHYNILGDPFLKVSYPTIIDNIEFTTLNDTLKIRQTVYFDGDFNNTSLNNNTHTLVYDSGLEYRYTIPSEPPVGVNLSRDNLPIFNGKSQLKTGEYSVGFVIPDDAKSGNKSKIFSLSVNPLNNQVYVNKKTNITISPEVLIVDNPDKPKIEIYLDNLSFIPGDTVSPNPTLIARISDKNGLNTIGSPGHNMMIVIDGSTEPIIATTGFEYDLDSYTHGTLTWKLNKLSPGRHSLKVIAFDSFNEISVADTWFIAAEEIPVQLEKVLVYPNPMKNDAYFTFELSHNSDVSINIFTITGRKIQTIKRNNLSKGYNQIFWNGRDADGDRIANNTYFYTIKANATEGKGSKEITEKFMMLR